MLRLAVQNLYQAIRPGGYYALLVGERRWRGRIYSIFADARGLCPGRYEGMLVKRQFNRTSDDTKYRNVLIPCGNEFLLVYRVPATAYGFVDGAIDAADRLRSIAAACWKAVVRRALGKVGGEGTLEEIYRVVARTARSRGLPRTWRATVRRTLQETAVRVGRGRWRERTEGELPGAAA